MNRKLLACLLVSLAVTTSNTENAFAYKGKFPGKGSRKAWEAASQLNDEGARLTDEEKKYTEAEHLIRKAIQIYPFDAGFYLNLGITLDHLNKWHAAELPLREAIRLAPREFDIHSELSVALAQQRKYRLAQEELTLASKFIKTFDQKRIYEHNKSILQEQMKQK